MPDQDFDTPDQEGAGASEPKLDIPDMSTLHLRRVTYSPDDWYWRADDGRIFGSARAAIVKDDDAQLVAWGTSGRRATPWPRDDAGAQTDAALQDVLTPHGLFVDPKAGLSIALKAECQRRIYAVASPNAQTNMTAYVAAGQASDADKAAFANALGWVAAMRGAYAKLLAAGDEAFADDGKWPPCPPDAAALAAKF